MYLLYPDTKSIDVIRCFLCHNGYRSLRYVDAPLYETNVPGSREPVIWNHSHISPSIYSTRFWCGTGRGEPAWRSYNSQTLQTSELTELTDLNLANIPASQSVWLPRDLAVFTDFLDSQGSKSPLSLEMGDYLVGQHTTTPLTIQRRTKKAYR